jgi:acyl-CoA thioester hydrolase
MALTHEATLRVIYGDTDQMGVVYYANYLRYFEHARNELIRAAGGSYVELEREGYGLPVVEANAKYARPARYDDLLRITVTVELKRASMNFSYLLRRDGEEGVLCEGITRHACVKDGKPTALPESLVRLFR